MPYYRHEACVGCPNFDLKKFCFEAKLSEQKQFCFVSLQFRETTKQKFRFVSLRKFRFVSLR